MTDVTVIKKEALTGHKDCIYSLEKGISENQFFSAGADGMVVQWDINDPQNGILFAKLSNSVYALKTFGNHIVIGENFEGIHIVDIKSRKEISSTKITSSYIFDIDIFQQEIFVVSGDGNLIIMDKDSLNTKIKIQLSNLSLRCIAFHPHHEIYAIGCSDNTIKILSAKKNQVLFNINAHQNSIFTIAFTSDGKFLISGSRDAHIKVWDCTNFELQTSIIAHMYAINNIKFTNDGMYFATCSMDKSIKIWDSSNFKLLKVIDKARYAGHSTSINKLLWLSNNLLVSASDDKTINVWDLNFNKK